MRFLFRAAFWLVVVSIFMPPESRVFNILEGAVPAHVGTASAGESGESACAKDDGLCQAAGAAIDVAVQLGVAGLAFVQEMIAPEEQQLAAREER